MDKIVIKFIENAAPYTVGDIATFTAEDAEKYLDAKVATKVKELKADKKESGKEEDEKKV